MTLTETWSFTTLAHLAGLAVPAEGPAFFAWDLAQRLYRLDRAGKPQNEETLPFQSACGAVSADGRTVAFLSERGAILLRDADGGRQRIEDLRIEPTALAVDPFGQHLLTADGTRHVQLLDRSLSRRFRIRMPRPIVHLAFALRRATWFGAAAQGYVAEHGRDGALLRKETPMYECGGVAVDADDSLLMACHGGGLRCFPGSARLAPLPELSPCERVAAAVGSGRLAIISTPAAGGESKLALLEASGAVSAAAPTPGRAIAVALAPRGEQAIVGLADGVLLGIAVG